MHLNLWLAVFLHIASCENDVLIAHLHDVLKQRSNPWNGQPTQHHIVGGSRVCALPRYQWQTI